MMISQILSVTLLVIVSRGLGFSTTRQVSLPLKKADYCENNNNAELLLKSAFQNVVDSTQFLVQSSQLEKENNICSVPVLGDNVVVQLRSNDDDGNNHDKVHHNQEPHLSEFVLTVDSGIEEFGLICLKFYENREMFQDIVDISDLHEAVIDHMERQPPHPGYEANTAHLAGSDEIKDLFQDTDILELRKKGFLILNNGPKSCTQGHDKLTKYLVEKTNQGDNVRTDTVHFLNRNQAKDCGFKQVSTFAVRPKTLTIICLKSLNHSFCYAAF